jgi:hypothetical protein
MEEITNFLKNQVKTSSGSVSEMSEKLQLSEAKSKHFIVMGLYIYLMV